MTSKSLQTNGAAPSAVPPLRPPTLKEAISALPLTGPGELTRERLANAGDAPSVIMSCLDDLAWLPGLVEVLRAASEAEDPTRTRRNGIDALARHLIDEISRISTVLQGALGELER